MEMFRTEPLLSCTVAARVSSWYTEVDPILRSVVLVVLAAVVRFTDTTATISSVVCLEKFNLSSKVYVKDNVTFPW